MKEPQNLTPVMQQYWKVKSLHPDKIVLFQMGDFFEMFYKDAETASSILNISLTARNKRALNPIPMCGVPVHSVSKCIGQLLLVGYKVAICNQVEESKSAKGLVERKVSRILSPGMTYDPSLLDELKAHYICAFDQHTCSFADGTTGTAFTYDFSSIKERDQLMALIEPVELVFDESQKNDLPKSLEHIHLSLHTQTFSSHSEKPESVQRLLSYIKKMGGEKVLAHLRPFEKRYINENLIISPVTLSHLEITKTFEGQSHGSLFTAVNRTRTAAGARLLKSRLVSPLSHLSAIQKRLNRVEFFIKNVQMCNEVRSQLPRVGDLERKLGKICSPSVHARDLLELGNCVQTSLQLLPFVPQIQNVISQEELSYLSSSLIKDIRQDTPLSLKEGGLFNKGVDPELDSLMNYSENSKSMIQEMEKKEKQKTGIPSLKIRYNQIFGYYIEVTKTHSRKIPSHYIRKQTLTQAERYSTEELLIIEEKVLKSRTCQIEKEYSMFQDRLEKVVSFLPDLHVLAQAMGELDVATATAHLALERNYVRPVFLDKANVMNLVNSRHPVIEQERPFTPNTISMKSGECLLLTGPNMAGKSTLMRQLALTAVMAQAGLYVPAESANLPLFRKLFTRIGSSDRLHSGLSTFMVEMKEASEILHQADENSLVILDELGRGTSTYDGLSLAQAILEYLISKNKSYTLFSTHYHELTSLQHPCIQQGHLAVQELKDDIDFLYTFRSGSCLRSYGISVGEKAGLPLSVIQRARHLLENFEKNTTLSKNSPDP